MHCGKRALSAISISCSDIQFPRRPLTPGFGVGMVSLRCRVEMNVFDSTLATSAGSVRASQQFLYALSRFMAP
ncbi:unnamed protein product [Protopolystoma xenopodis]|uniref:Uncharacterized protein n=1 Tax=Protopolystoma xenopodis TaxID=117903 RepID=A0A3S5BW12_9PLAT|nr:unnamed protein product [Protopolystoma xenopodis]